MNETPRRNVIRFLETARDQYEADFQYDPRCPYNSADEFVEKVKEVLQSGYDYDTESYILEHIPYWSKISSILAVVNVDAACSGISFITQEAAKRMRPFWERNQAEFPILLQLTYSRWMENLQKAQTRGDKRIAGNKTVEQRRKSFTKKLRKAVKYLHSADYLPESMLDLTMRTDALWYNATSQFSGLLFAIIFVQYSVKETGRRGRTNN